MSMRRLAPLCAVAALVAGLASCGDEPSTVARDPAGAAGEEFPVMVVDDEVQVSCDGERPAWAPSLMQRGGDPALGEHDEVVDALERLAAEMPMDAPAALLDADGIRDGDWILLAREEDRGREVLMVGAGPWSAQGPGKDAEIMGLVREADRWEVNWWGGCSLAPVLQDPRSMWAEVSAPQGGLARDLRTITVEVSEIECTSSRDPSPFLHEPFVVETDEAVTVYWTSTRPVGGQTCPGNPAVERSLELERPLGGRTLLDGSRYPATPIS